MSADNGWAGLGCPSQDDVGQGPPRGSLRAPDWPNETNARRRGGHSDVPMDQIDVLSVGTTSAPFNIANNREAGVIKWNVGMINLMFEAQAEAAFEEAKLLLNDRIFRIYAITKPGEFSLDEATPDKIAQLMNLGRGEAVKRETFAWGPGTVAIPLLLSPLSRPRP